MVAPSVRAATDCLARFVALDARAMTANTTAALDGLIRSKIDSCKVELAFMVDQHDRYFYPGKGVEFFKGPYMADLPRAVSVRIKPELDRQRVALAQAESLKASQIASAEKSRNLLRDKAYECVEDAIRGLLNAKESADVMTTAAMTICRKSIQDMRSAFVDLDKAKGQYSVDLESSYDQLIRTTFRENVLTMAVRIKAEVASSANKTAVTSTPLQPDQSGDAEGLALKKCLAIVADVQKDANKTPKEKTETMLQLCRTEIESLARARYLKDTKIDLDSLRAEALNLALAHSKSLVGDPNPSH